jgi:hypothetical protein
MAFPNTDMQTFTVAAADLVDNIVGTPQPVSAATLVVVDPLTRKLVLPRHIVCETQALGRVGTPSICMLFLSGRCRQGAQCHQVHADPATVLHLREEAKKLPTCCGDHNDAFSGRMLPAWRTRSIDINGVVLPADKLAFTIGLGKLLTDTTAEVIRTPPQLVCRLHITNRCRYAEDCKFLHVCREEVESKLSAWVQPMIPQFELRQMQQVNGTTVTPPRSMSSRSVSPQMAPMRMAPFGMPAGPAAGTMHIVSPVHVSCHAGAPMRPTTMSLSTSPQSTALVAVGRMMQPCALGQPSGTPVMPSPAFGSSMASTPSGSPIKLNVQHAPMLPMPLMPFPGTVAGMQPMPMMMMPAPANTTMPQAPPGMQFVMMPCPQQGPMTVAPPSAAASDATSMMPVMSFQQAMTITATS